MLDEWFFKEGYVRSRGDFVLFGFLVTLIGIISAIAIFGKRSSVAQILIITILLMPLINKLFSQEEKIIRSQGVKDIFRAHSRVFNTFLLLFVGIFFAYFITQLITIHKPDLFPQAFEYQIDYITKNEQITYGFTDQVLSGSTSIIKSPVGKLLLTNLLIVVLGFVFSFFYGAGGIFLLILAASTFSTLIIFTFKSLDIFLPYTIIFSIFFVLFIVPLILSSIAGGALSRAFISEKIRSKHFETVLKDVYILFFSAVGLVILISIVWFIVWMAAVRILA